jgi:hypothetical protein
MELHIKAFDDNTINIVLQNVAYELKVTNHSSLSASPCQLVFGRDMGINAIYLANWKLSVSVKVPEFGKITSTRIRTELRTSIWLENQFTSASPILNKTLSHFTIPSPKQQSKLMAPLQFIVQ